MARAKKIPVTVRMSPSLVVLLRRYVAKQQAKHPGRHITLSSVVATLIKDSLPDGERMRAANPTADEIRERAAEVQSTWSEWMRERRRSGLTLDELDDASLSGITPTYPDQLLFGHNRGKFDKFDDWGKDDL